MGDKSVWNLKLIYKWNPLSKFKRAGSYEVRESLIIPWKVSGSGSLHGQKWFGAQKDLQTPFLPPTRLHSSKALSLAHSVPKCNPQPLLQGCSKMVVLGVPGPG